MRESRNMFTLDGMATGYRILEHATREFILDRTRDTDGEPRGDGIAEFAALIGVSYAHLSKVINGHLPLTFEMGRRIARGLGVRWRAVMEPVETDTDAEQAVAQ